jgi:hypothetical protein
MCGPHCPKCGDRMISEYHLDTYRCIHCGRTYIFGVTEYIAGYPKFDLVQVKKTDTTESIAYRLWESASKPGHRDKDFWNKAERIVAAVKNRAAL